MSEVRVHIGADRVVIEEVTDGGPADVVAIVGLHWQMAEAVDVGKVA